MKVCPDERAVMFECSELLLSCSWIVFKLLTFPPLVAASVLLLAWIIYGYLWKMPVDLL